MTRTARLDYAKADVRMYVTTPIEENYRLNACAKEPWTIEWIESMPPGSVLYDVGSNVGSYTLVAAKLGHLVIAIEPCFANYARLCENVLLNDLGPQVIPLCLGVGRGGDTPVYKQQLEPGFSGGTQALRGLMLPMASIPALFGVPEPSHIKVDVDGPEDDVIAGAPLAQSFMVECTRTKTDAVSAMLQQAGYTLTQRYDQRVEGTGPPLKWSWYGRWDRRVTDVIDSDW